MSAPAADVSERAQNCPEATLHLDEQVLQRHGSRAASSAPPSICQHTLPSPGSGQGKGASGLMPQPPPPTSCLLWLNKALCSLLTPVRFSVVGLRWGKFLVCEDCEGPALLSWSREGSEVNEKHSAGHLPPIHPKAHQCIYSLFS